MAIYSGVLRPEGFKPRAKYQWAAMAVDDCMMWPVDDAHLARSAAAAYKCRHPGWDYESLVRDGILTIWRTA